MNANEMAWTSHLTRNETVKSARQLYLQNCANCHGDTLAGSPPQLPKLLNMGPKWDIAAISKITRQGAGRMPGFPNLSDAEVKAVSEYILSGESKPIESDEPAAVTQDYRFTGYRKFLDPDGYPAVAPPWGTLNAINLNTGEFVWKIPFGEYPELAEQGQKDTGSESYGGPVVTAGGLVFIAATNYDRKFRAFDKTTGKLLWETTLPFSGNATPAIYSAGGTPIHRDLRGGQQRSPERSERRPVHSLRFTPALRLFCQQEPTEEVLKIYAQKRDYRYHVSAGGHR